LVEGAEGRERERERDGFARVVGAKPFESVAQVTVTHLGVE
jgi:hypothetical protein